MTEAIERELNLEYEYAALILLNLCFGSTLCSQDDLAHWSTSLLQLDFDQLPPLPHSSFHQRILKQSHKFFILFNFKHAYHRPCSTMLCRYDAQ